LLAVELHLILLLMLRTTRCRYILPRNHVGVRGNSEGVRPSHPLGMGNAHTKTRAAVRFVCCCGAGGDLLM
jgi:hypothetical protein